MTKGIYMVTDEIEKAIRSAEFKSTLEILNEYFYNRKHEGQIRDSILICINKNSCLKGFSEHPKCRAGAVDLSLLDKQNESVATIEFKHHYPKDLNLASDREAIIFDMTRTVKEKTTHFILILQERKQKSEDIFPPLKYMERNDEYQEKYTFLIDKALNEIPLEYSKSLISITVEAGPVLSKYTFIIYDFIKNN